MTADATDDGGDAAVASDDECNNEEFVRLLLFVIYGFWSIWLLEWFGEAAPTIELFEFGVVVFWF